MLSVTDIQAKLHSKTLSAYLIDFFLVESNTEGPRLKFEVEDGRTDSEKMAHASLCDVTGATSQSCKVTQAIRNAHDQPCCRTTLDLTNLSTDNNVHAQDETDRTHQKTQLLFRSFSLCHEDFEGIGEKGVVLGSMTHPDQKRSSKLKVFKWDQSQQVGRHDKITSHHLW